MPIEGFSRHLTDCGQCHPESLCKCQLMRLITRDVLPSRKTAGGIDPMAARGLLLDEFRATAA